LNIWWILALKARMSAFANMPISRKLMVAFAAVVAVIFVSGAITYGQLGVLDESLNRHRQSDHMGEALDAMMTAMLDQETGVRGYLVSGDESFLEPYHTGGDAFTTALLKAKALTTNNPAQMRRLDALNELAKEWRRIAGREIALMAKPETREEARAVEGSKFGGKTAMDRIRAKVDEIEAIELDFSTRSLAAYRRANATLNWVTIIARTASLIVAMLMGFLLTRSVTMPITRMTKAMAALAKGDTSVEIPGVDRTDEIGAMAAAVQIFRDSIIDRNRAERALQESEEKWRAIFENNPAMYFMIDAAGTILSVNPFGAEHLGYTVDELTGDSVLTTFYEEDRATALQNAATCFEQPGRTMSWELRKMRKDGSMLWVRETAKATLIEERPVVLIVCEDITDRKWAEYLTAHLFESSPDGICLIGRDYRYQRVNPGHARNSGLPVERIVGKHVADLLGTDAFEQIVKPNLDLCFTGADVSFAEWFTYARGRRYVAVTYSPLRRGSERVEAALVIVRDLTDHMLASEALRAAQAELAHANRVATMGQLTASIAHEVRQPITAAVANANATLRWLDLQPPELDEARQAVSRIIENGRRADNVIRRIRDIIKKAPPRMDRFDLNEAVLDVIPLTRSELLRHGVSLQTELATGLPPVEGDRTELQQVMLNLIMNAIEAMSGADKEAPRSLRISTEKNASGDALVTVTDSGPGLEPQAADRLFQAFYTTKTSGMGMGLAICRSIIEGRGGRLWVTANEPQGATFHFTYPLARDVSVSVERVA
jgi:PAS domain S-box-containing protein